MHDAQPIPMNRTGWIPGRNELFAALVFVCAANGLLTKAIDAAQGYGSISPVILLGLVLAVRALAIAPSAAPGRWDWSVAGVAALLAWWPLHAASWVALTIVALYLLFSEPKGTQLRAGAAIALVLTVQPFWGRFIETFLGPWLERIDISAVAAATGALAHSNRLDFAHGPGGLVVTWGCTSFANASLALLLWVALTRTVRPTPKPGEWLTLAGVFATVFVINTVRLCLMAQSLSMQHALHGDAGQFWIGLLLLLSSLAWCAYGLRRELAN
jgi:hypothetical protein